MEGVINNKKLQKKLANQIHDMMLGKLQDIEGVDSVDWLPLAPGWWMLIIITVLLLIKFLIGFLRKRAYRRTWQYKILEELGEMQKNLSPLSAQNAAIKLSEIIRRLAIYKYSRIECASLEGKTWLSWLKQHDYYKFDWEKHGKLLIESVYAAPNDGHKIVLKELSCLIEATKKWVV